MLNTAHELDVPVFIMGNGSNLLVSDNGIKALVIKIGESLSEINIDGQRSEVFTVEYCNIRCGSIAFKRGETVNCKRTDGA